MRFALDVSYGYLKLPGLTNQVYYEERESAMIKGSVLLMDVSVDAMTVKKKTNCFVIKEKKTQVGSPQLTPLGSTFDM